MKKLLVYVFVCLVSSSCFAQLPSNVPDTLAPKRDTVKGIPKLTGGALIDTINTKENKYKHRPAHINDSLQKPPKQKK